MKVKTFVSTYVYEKMVEQAELKGLKSLSLEQNLNDMVQYCLGRSYFIRSDHFKELFTKGPYHLDAEDVVAFDVELDSVCQEICNSIVHFLVEDLTDCYSKEKNAKIVINIACTSFVECLKVLHND